jgi:hypothetical protein
MNRYLDSRDVGPEGELSICWLRLPADNGTSRFDKIAKHFIRKEKTSYRYDLKLKAGKNGGTFA